jgi:hypothetical protein
MTKLRFTLSLLSMTIAFQSAIHAQVLTAQYNNLRTGTDLHERILKPSNVNSRDFGKLFSRTLDGDVFAQPLYVPSLAIPGKGARDVIFGATEHDTVYAFDLNGTRDAPLWKTTFADPPHGITRADMTVRFAIPSIADGHVFIGARGRLDVYGLLNPRTRPHK